jgi:Spherulation-specific family 4
MWIVTSIFLAALVPSLVHPASAATQSSTGLIVPLYGYPSATWTTLAQQKLANPSVPIVAVINPSNGPGTAQDPNFVSGIQTLKSAGITVIGYTDTSYAGSPLSSVESAILGYKTLYGLSGVYLDEMSNVPGHESYYSTLTQYADSIGMSLVIGNPGHHHLRELRTTIALVLGRMAHQLLEEQLRHRRLRGELDQPVLHRERLERRRIHLRD